MIDNSGVHPAIRRTGAVKLARGPHLVVIDYVQGGGRYALEWEWSEDGARFERVPAWALSPGPVGHAAVLLARVLDWLVWILACVVVGCAAWVIRGWTAWRRPAGCGRRARSRPRASRSSCVSP